MAKFKELCKTVWQWTWECLKHSIMPLIMYVTCSIALAMFSLSIESPHWSAGTPARYWLWAGVGLIPLVYHGLLSFFVGGSGYDMLVAGNMKRMTNNGDVMMSSHQEEKEYRVWKGFAIGGLMALITIVVALIWGLNQDAIQQLLMRATDDTSTVNLGTSCIFLLGMGWSWAIMPVMFLNASGVYVSYFVCMLFAILPVVVSGVLYIIGAYARRRKRLAKLDAEEKALAEKEARKQKINYGGLPGTKPKKK